MKKQLLFILLIVSGFGALGQNFQWANSYKDYRSQGGKVISDGNGNIYQHCLIQGYTEYDPITSNYIYYSYGSLITKQTISGKIIWNVTFAGITNSMLIDKKGNIYLTGNFIGKPDFDPSSGTNILNSEGSDDVFILKLDASGKLLLAKRVGGKNSDVANLIELDNSMNINITGTFNGLVDFDPGAATYKINGSGSFNLKLDSLGNFVSVKTGKEPFKQTVKDSKGNLYFTGSFSGKVDFDPDSINTFYLTSIADKDIFVQKLDPKGKLIWAKSMGGKITDVGNAIAVDKKGNVYTTGFFEDSIDLDPSSKYYYLGCAGKTDAFISKLDSLGNFVWGLSMGGIDKEVGNLIALDDSANVYCTGLFEDTVEFDPSNKKYNLTSSGLQDIFILKINSSGKFLWAKKLGGSNQEYLTNIIIDKNQNIYGSGYFSGTLDFNPDEGQYNITANSGYNSYLFKLGPCPSPAENISGQAALCGGATKGTYSITPSAGANGYKWTVPKGATIDSGQNTAKIKVTFGSTLGDITVRPSNICDTTIKSVLTIKNFPAINVTANVTPSTTICKGSYARLYGNGANTYTWNKGIINNNNFYPDTTDTYIVTGTDNYGCIGKDTIILIVNGVASPTAINGPSTVCGGGGKATFSVTPIAGATGYIWTVPNNATIDSGKNTPAIRVSFGSSSGYITVNTTNACNTTPINKYISVTVPSIGITVQPSATICKGTSIILNGTGGSNYTWSGGISNGLSFKPDTTTTYTLTETGSAGCAGTKSILITVNPLPNVEAMATPSNKICSGASVTLTAKGASSYQWSAMGVTTGAAFKPGISAKYTVTGTDNNGCSNTATLDIMVIAAPVISLQPASKTVAEGSASEFYLVTTNPNNTFQWQWRKPSFPASEFININNTNEFSGTDKDTLKINPVTNLLNKYEFRNFVTKDGCSTISNVAILTVKSAVLKTVSTLKRISIYPNPAINQITIESNHTLNNEPYTITNQTGRQLLKGELNSKTNQIDISILAKGFYFIQIGEADKEIFKIVKQ
ncbi:MAG: T9SS type A sorting domain-containing protein [Bacteroidia bacterium]